MARRAAHYGFKEVAAYSMAGCGIVVPSGRLVVQFRGDPGLKGAADILRYHGLQLLRMRKRHPGQYVAAAAFTQNVFAVSREVAQEKCVAWCEPDLVTQPRPRYMPDDPLLANQWALHNTGQCGGATNRDVYAQPAWDITMGTSTVVIAVLDDGFDIDHADLSANLYTNTADPLNGLDDDGNGYTDDVHGWDFNDDDNDPRGSPTNAHGTAVLGPMIAVTDNGIGVAGLANGCRFLPVRIFGEWPNDLQLVDAIEYAADNAAIMNISYYISSASVVRDALRYAVSRGRGGKGCLVCTALGNDGVRRGYEADLAAAPEVLTVSGISNYRRRSYFADFGPPLNLCAPAGGGSTNLYTTDRTGADGYTNGDYCAEWAGTSAASPIAAGAAALVLSIHPEWSALRVWKMLEDSCDRVDAAANPYDARGWTAEYGHGALNAWGALTDPAPALDPYEPDDASSAPEIVDGQMQYREISPASDNDWAFFGLGATSMVRATIVGATDIVLRLYDQWTNLQMTVNPSPYTVLTATNLSAGRYLVRCSSSSGNPVGEYGLHFGVLNQVDAFENDDSAAAAGPIDPRVRQHRSLYPAGDVDWAFFALSNAAYVELTTFGEVDGNTVLRLYDASGTNMIAENDDDPRMFGYYYSYLATQLVAGTYYVQVSEYSNNILCAYSLIYEVHRPDPHEPDDSAAQAVQIAPGQHISYTLYPAGDHDWLTFELTNRADVLVLTDSINPLLVGDTYLKLYDGQTNLIAENDDGNAGYFSAIFRSGMDTGRYYIEVEGVPGYTTTIETNPDHYVALDVFPADTTISAITLATNGIGIRWDGDGGRYYSIQSGDGESWTNVAEVEGRPGTNRWTDLAPGGVTCRWYRLTGR